MYVTFFSCPGKSIKGVRYGFDIDIHDVNLPVIYIINSSTILVEYHRWLHNKSSNMFLIGWYNSSQLQCSHILLDSSIKTCVMWSQRAFLVVFFCYSWSAVLVPSVVNINIGWQWIIFCDDSCYSSCISPHSPLVKFWYLCDK